MAAVPIIVLSLVLGLMCHSSLMAGPDEERAGLDSAGAWLTLVDAGEYDKSWDQAASLFKDKFKQGSVGEVPERRQNAFGETYLEVIDLDDVYHIAAGGS